MVCARLTWSAAHSAWIAPLRNSFSRGSHSRDAIRFSERPTSRKLGGGSENGLGRLG